MEKDYNSISGNSSHPHLIARKKSSYQQMIKNPLTISKVFKLIEAFKMPNEETICDNLIKRTTLSWSFAQNRINQLHEKGYITKSKLKGRTRPIKLTEKGKKVYYILKELRPLLETK